MCSNDVKRACQSWGGILAVSLVLIVIVFALFTTSGPAKKNFGVRHQQANAEDIREMQAKHKNITVKQGQKLVIF